MTVSVIVTTYNWPSALELVLQSLHQQNIRPDQVLIADDGSGVDTANLVQSWHAKWPAVHHVWQPDDGFRAGEARNRAIAAATGDWLVMIDGDCICPPDFIEHHLQLAASEVLVAGNRLLLNPQQTKKALESSNVDVALAQVVSHRKLRRLALGFLRDLFPKRWQAVRTCNLGVARATSLSIMGFDETYQGWGKEDSDFAARCIHAGARIRLGQFACTVIHLHHDEESRDRLSRNQGKLDRVLQLRAIEPEKSLLKDDQ